MLTSSVMMLAAVAGFHAADLTPLAKSDVKRLEPDRIVWVRDGKAAMPIVAKSTERARGNRKDPRNIPSCARWLADSVFEMTGVKPPIVLEWAGETATNAPALYVGTEACRAFGEPVWDPHNDGSIAKTDEFRVVTKDGSVYFTGRVRHGVYDFGERVLGIRQYWETSAGGRSVVKADEIVLPELDYSDRPVYLRRLTFPYEGADWANVHKSGNSWPVHCNAHQPYRWWGDTNFNYKVTRPEIFQLGRDGKRQPPMLCYGNPRTLETYKERLELELAGGPKAGMYNAAAKTVSVSQWDALVDCQCEHCKPLYDPSRGTTGNASPVIWGFAAKLADWLHEKHPDITVTILPYLNTCDVPKGIAFPHKNVEAEVCSMPGLALFKNKDVADHEEKLIRDWAAVTGRPIRGWNYLCWPVEFCNAPYLFGHATVDHLKRMRGVIVGEFINGMATPPERKLTFAACVWLRALWNPEIDVEAIYDAMCARMFGAAAKPMRRLVAMQEGGWNRQWGAGQVSNKNIYEISYPRKEVIEMEKLIAEARALAAGDALTLKRIDRHTVGWQPFFDESRNLAEGTALEPTLIKKVAADPVVDGRLDDEAWKIAPAYDFVHARNKEKPAPRYPTKVQMVWTPNGVTFGVRATEPLAGDPEVLARLRKATSDAMEEIEIFLDVSGTGNGHWYQIFATDDVRTLFYTDGPNWLPKGVRKGVHWDKGWWSMELFVPFADLKEFPEAQMPSGTAAEGKFWLGNIMRKRSWDGGFWGEKKKLKTSPDSAIEFSRRYTRYSIWSKDQSAFGKLQFVE